MQRFFWLFRTFVTLGSNFFRWALFELAIPLLTSVVPFLAAGGAIWYLAASPEPYANLALALLLFGCYGLAGLVWGFRVVANRAESQAAQHLQEHVRRTTDAVLHELTLRTSLANRRIEIAAVRQAWKEASRLAGETGAGLLRLPLLNKLIGWVLVQSLAARTRLAEQFLSSLEAKGETHITAESLKDYVCEQMLVVARNEGRRQLMVTNACCHLLMLFLVSIPLLVFYTGRIPR